MKRDGWCLIQPARLNIRLNTKFLEWTTFSPNATLPRDYLQCKIIYYISKYANTEHFKARLIVKVF